ncbi:hypothetical protein [Archangium violaceum]|uniref:AAA family ATPase n=1 Tax=Archangium violaceum Cb vi76 TaxID=1406225 RepID=A0A084SQJ0_9BACT|nr:hypothetical protein [Archangium violaceum]KFA90725.1 hypothetical protein Q664_26795 [Archangium violaceum Cb vi76]
MLLTAPRRWGKSSLMYALHDQPWPAWSVRQLDVEYVETPAQFLTELAANLLQLDPVLGVFKKTRELPTSLVRWVSGALSEVEVGALGDLKLKLRDSLRDEQWPELAEQLLGQLQRLEGSLLIVIDEFPMMVDTFLDKDQEGCLRFLRWVRAQRRPQQGLMLRFLLGGSVNIEPRLERLAQEAVLNDLERFQLQPLPLDRAIEFVTEVLKGESVPFEEGTPRKIVETAGTGVHFFLQVLINECMSEMRQQRWPRLLVEHIQPAYESRVLGPPNRARFSHYHSRLKSNYGALEEPARLLLAELARAPVSNVDELRMVLLRHGLDKVELDDLVARLESDYYVTRSGGEVRFHSNFLKDWWLRNAPGIRRKP